jgi:acarbose 7IV-phosphotransferase
MRVFVLGGLSFDTIVYLDVLPPPVPHMVTASRFHETIGETGAGKALNLKKLGFQVVFHALLGDDVLGDCLAATLGQDGIDFIREPDPRGTRRHVNLMDASGGRLSISVAQEGPEPRIDHRPMEALLPECDYVVLNIDDYCRDLIQPIKSAGKEIWCDVHDYDGRNAYHEDFIAAADYLFLSSDLLPDYPAFMERMRHSGKRLVVCTHGRDGSSALSADGQWMEVPSLPGIPLRDSNGAGDAYFAGYLYGHARGYDVLRCMQLGTLVGGLCITSSELAHPQLSRAWVETAWSKQYGGAARGM